MVFGPAVLAFARQSDNTIQQLSVGKRLETYLSSFCGIEDINVDFKKWILQKSQKMSK